MLLAIGGIMMFAAGSVFFFGDRIVNADRFASNILSAQAPPDTDDPFLLGQFYFNQDGDPSPPYDLKKARQYYEQAVTDNPKGHPLSWYQLGRVYFVQGYLDHALFAFRQQQRYFQDEIPNVHYMTGLTYLFIARQSSNEHDWQQAARGFTTFLSFYPDNVWARVDLATVYFGQGQFQEMLPVLQPAFESRPNNPWVRNMMGLALLHHGDAGEAREHFTAALTHAQALGPADWGRVNPENDPRDWGEGLRAFLQTIEHNLGLVYARGR